MLTLRPRPNNCRRVLAKIVVAALVVASGSLVAPPLAEAQTVTVLTVNGATGADSGNCIASPCRSLPYALSQAATGDTIDIVGSVNAFSSAASPPTSGAIIPSDITSITLDGLPAPGVTALVGPGAVTGGVGSVLSVGANQEVTVENLVIEDGNAPKGGGIYNSLGTVSLVNDLVTTNAASNPIFVSAAPGVGPFYNYSDGGGIYNGGTMSIIDSAIEDNTIDHSSVPPPPGAGTVYYFAYGAGIYNEGQLTVEDSTVAFNLTVRGGTSGDVSFAGYGGGIFNNSQQMTILGSSIVRNSAGSTGGGIYEGPGFLGSPQMAIGASIVAANDVVSAPLVSQPQDCALAPGDSTPSSLGYNVTDAAANGGCGFTGPTDLSGAAVNLVGTQLSSHDSLSYPSSPNPYLVFAPVPGSPGTGNISFGASLSNGSLACPGLDQLGNQRPAPGSDACDSGAIETGSSAVTPLAPSITSASITTFTVGEAGTFTFSAKASPPAAFSAPSGSLPTGVSLSPSGDLSGTPALGTVGTYGFLVAANNSLSPVGEQQFILTVAKEPSTTTLTVKPSTLGTSGGQPQSSGFGDGAGGDTHWHGRGRLAERQFALYGHPQRRKGLLHRLARLGHPGGCHDTPRPLQRRLQHRWVDRLGKH